MAQFRGTVEGGRSVASRLGHKTTGLATECNGWDTGVKVEAQWNEKLQCDEFYIFHTNGSSMKHKFVQIAKITGGKCEITKTK